MMDSIPVIEQLKRTPLALKSLMDGIDQGQALWKPDHESWSAVEVINHLVDEEKEDFRRHLQDCFKDPQPSWHRIAPQRWVQEREYQKRDFQQSLQCFCDDREQSLHWLKELHDIDWDLTYEAPFGKIKAGDLLVSWAAHDLLHLRQMLELLYGYSRKQAAPCLTIYAGDW